MPRLTLRTLLAYIDDTLAAPEARSLGKKVAASDEARSLVERIKKVTRRRGLAAPTSDDEHDPTADPNTVAEYLDNALDSDTVRQVEETCLESDVHLAEVAACHQILTLVLTEPVRVPPRAHRRMYELVQPPASVADRRPSKTLPIGGAAPPADGPVETDDADAALLLGMQRYSASTTWAARLALLGAVALLLVLLAGAVLKILLPPDSPQPPAMAKHTPGAIPSADPKPGTLEPGAPKPDPAKPKDPVSVPVVVKPKEKDPALAGDTIPPPRPVGPDLWAKIDPPIARRAPIGRIDLPHVLVMSYRGEPGVWGRVAHKPVNELADQDSIHSTDPVMALPGYKANVLLGDPNKPVVEVHLWGNVPEQLAYRVLESKVTFHQPGPGFDADLTLHAGRIYLKSTKLDAEKKPVGAKVRVRLGNTNEVWDVTLPDANADVLVELISWFKPGTPFAIKGGDEPRREARVAVVRGPAAFQVTGDRFKKFDRLDGGTQVFWDSVTGALSEPALVTNIQEIMRVPALEGDSQKNITRVLSGMADAVTTPDRLGTVLRVRLENPPAELGPSDLVSRVAVFAWGATAESNEAGCASLKELVAILNLERPLYTRQAVVTALVQWVGREKGNTALLHAFLSKPESGVPATTVNAVVEMLRGYISPLQPDPARLEALLERLGGVKAEMFGKPESAIALREVALWNLTVADTGLWVPPAFSGNIATPADAKKILAFWTKQVAEIKNRPAKTP